MAFDLIKKHRLLLIIMMVSPNKIKSESFRELLSIFRDLDLDLVVWGGACRDLLFSINFPNKYSLDNIINDFDIAVIIDRSESNDNLYYNDFGDQYRILSVMEKYCKKLCNFWNIDINDLCDENNKNISGLKFPVGLVGLRSVFDSDGNPFPDCFAIKNGESFNAVPICLSINSFAIDGYGKIYGPAKCFDDFLARTARILRPPVSNKYSLPLLVRFFNYIVKFDMKIDEQTRNIIRKHIKQLYNSTEILAESAKLNWTQQLINKNCRNKMSNMLDLDTIKTILMEYDKVLVRSG